MTCKVIERKVIPPRKAPSNQEAIFFLSDSERQLFVNMLEVPGNALLLSDAIGTRLKLMGREYDRPLMIAEDWGVYMKPQNSSQDFKLLCLKVKKLCPENKLHDEMYRPLSNCGKVLGPATEQEIAAYVAISCLKDRVNYHAAFDDLDRMNECLVLIGEVEEVLYSSIKSKYDLDENQKFSFNKYWEITLI